MKMTGNIIRQGVSETGGFRLDYTLTYGPDNRVRKVEAEIKRRQPEGPGLHIGYASHAEEPFRHTFQLSAGASAEERRLLADDFESTLKELAEQWDI